MITTRAAAACLVPRGRRGPASRAEGGTWPESGTGGFPPSRRARLVEGGTRAAPAAAPACTPSMIGVAGSSAAAIWRSPATPTTPAGSGLITPGSAGSTPHSLPPGTEMTRELSELESEEIIFAYADDDVPIEQLVEKYGVPSRTVRQLLHDRGVLRNVGAMERLHASERAREVAASLAAKGFYTTAELAEIFSVGTETVRGWAKTGKIASKPVRHTGTTGYLFPVSVVNEIIGISDDES